MFVLVRSRRSPLIALAWCLSSRGFAAETPPVVDIHVPSYFVVEIPDETRERAFEEVARIYEPGGLRVRWERPGEGERQRGPIATLVVQARPAVHVVHGCRRNRHDHRLGHTNLRTRRLTLWTDQVRRAVHGDWDRAPDDVPLVDEGVFARALGRVLAHELGHLLLSLDGHRDGGLMRSSFSHRSLTGRSAGAFRLSPGDLGRIRSAVLRFLDP